MTNDGYWPLPVSELAGERPLRSERVYVSWLIDYAVGFFF